MPGTKNRVSQPPANARARRMEHLERVARLRARKTKSPERQARLHPSRMTKRFNAVFNGGRSVPFARARAEEALNESFIEGPGHLELGSLTISDHSTIGVSEGIAQMYVRDREYVVDAVATRPLHPLPWRALDKREGKGAGSPGWIIVDANGQLAEYAKSRDKARARAREVNGA